MSSLSILLALLTAVSLMAALERRPPDNVARWLWAQLVYMPFVWVTGYVWGNESYAYVVVYCVFTALILYAAVRIAVDCLIGRGHPFKAVIISAVLASVLARVTWLDLRGQWAWISVSEGFLLLWAGILTSFSGAYRPRWDLYVPLGVFWVLQGGYSLGWAIHGKLWAEWNWVVPPAMGLVCFSYLALRLRPHERTIAQQ